MSITHAEILATVNEAFETTYAAANIANALRMALNDLSRMHVLKAEDTSQSTSTSTVYLDYPSDALNTDQAIISVQLTDSNGVDQGRLQRLRGGWREYRSQMEEFNTSHRSEPSHFVTHDRRIYLFVPPGAVYTTSIWYYRRHPELTTDGTSVFEDEWQTAIEFGTIRYKAMLLHDRKFLNIYDPIYRDEKEQMRLQIPREPSIEGA